MSVSDDRERSLERLLKIVPSPPMGEPAADCLDAEMLAAWSDGGLDAASARHVEAHLSTCARCQAMAAAFARSTPATASVRTSGFRWMLPAGAVAAAALAVWFVLPARAPVQAPDASMARNEPGAAGLPEAAFPAPAPASERESRSAASSMPQAAGQAKSRQLRQAASGPVAAPDSGASLVSRAPAPVAAPPSPPPATVVPAPVPPSMPAREESARATAVQAQSGERSFSISSETLAANVSNPTVAEFSAAQPTPASADLRVGGAGRAGNGVVVPLTRWRVLRDGRVQRLGSGAAAWESVDVPAGVRISGGVAPGPLVCWLIGPQGVVLRSTDGQRFTRVASPDTADLREISATDDRVATVTTRDNRTFATTDGGASWRALVQ